LPDVPLPLPLETEDTEGDRTVCNALREWAL
jgi:hypothetical protein